MGPVSRRIRHPREVGSCVPSAVGRGPAQGPTSRPKSVSSYPRVGSWPETTRYARSRHRRTAASVDAMGKAARKVEATELRKLTAREWEYFKRGYDVGQFFARED